MSVYISLLGQFRVTVDGREITASEWPRERSAALVKLLALSAGRRLHREQVMESLWPEMEPEAAAANLRKAAHFARRALGQHDLIGVRSEHLTLAPGQDVEIDADLFETEAQAALRAGDAVACARAADRYTGELLPDDRYAEWTEGPRERLRVLDLRLLKAAGLWERALAIDPTDEAAQRELMQAALDAGNRAEVIRQFQRLRERLRVDLGVGPAAATVALYERALAAEAQETVSVTDRVRASLAWGIVHLQSGEFAQAERVARDARLVAIEASLAREVGEASALYGLVAHMQGRWPELFRSEFIEWVRQESRFTETILDAHVCLAEFCLCGASGHEEVARGARELLAIAEGAGSLAGRALATLILGETELCSGRLDAAERLLEDAGRAYHSLMNPSGQVIAMQRLAEVALARGQRYRAGRFARRGFGLAESSWLAPHLVIRLQALAVETARTPAETAEAIRNGDHSLASGATCQPCSMSYRMVAAKAVARAGDLEQAARRLDEAERLAGMWNGGPWVAAVWEGRAVYRQAQGNQEQAAALFREAAARYAALGRPFDQQRCLTQAQIA